MLTDGSAGCHQTVIAHGMIRLINVVVPMAGRGSRFAGTGERGPKPLIEVRPGRIMLDYVADYLQFDEPYRLILVGLAEHANDPRLTAFMRRIGPRHRLVLTETLTNGPAATALLARDLLEADDELIVAYCDGAIELDMQGFIDRMRQRAADGAVLVFPSAVPTNAYARLADDRVEQIAEKQVISGDSVAGVYYFRRAADYVRAAERLLTANAGRREIFVSTTYNVLIEAGGVVLAEHIAVDQIVEMGTPADLLASRAFLARSLADGAAAK